MVTVELYSTVQYCTVRMYHEKFTIPVTSTHVLIKCQQNRDFLQNEFQSISNDIIVTKLIVEEEISKKTRFFFYQLKYFSKFCHQSKSSMFHVPPKSL